MTRLIRSALHRNRVNQDNCVIRVIWELSKFIKSCYMEIVLQEYGIVAIFAPCYIETVLQEDWM